MQLRLQDLHETVDCHWSVIVTVAVSCKPLLSTDGTVLTSDSSELTDSKYQVQYKFSNFFSFLSHKTYDQVPFTDGIQRSQCNELASVSGAVRY